MAWLTSDICLLLIHPIQHNHDPAFSHEQQVLRGTAKLGGIRVADDKVATTRQNSLKGLDDQWIVRKSWMKLSLPQIGCISDHAVLDGEFTTDKSRPEHLLPVFIHYFRCKDRYRLNIPGVYHHAGKNFR